MACDEGRPRAQGGHPNGPGDSWTIKGERRVDGGIEHARFDLFGPEVSLPPDDLFGALDGRQLAGKVGPAYLLVTSDEDGTPRPCMLSAGEVLAVDARRVRFALWKGSRTCAMGSSRRSGASWWR